MPNNTSNWVDDFAEWSILIVAILAMVPIVVVTFLVALAAVILISPVVLIWWIALGFSGRS